MKHIVFTVTNDLTYDQRMQRICTALTESGFECTLIGRERSTSSALDEYPFKQVRLRCWFEKGKLFYLEYNIRLFFTLLTMRPYAFCAIDLDTALPVYCVAKIQRKAFVFDSHEYFSELEEVVTRPLVHKVWQWVERFVMKRFDAAYTISDGYAKLFLERYGATFQVIRNVPIRRELPSTTPEPYVIYQGALNVGRGLEESVRAMKDIDGLSFKIFGEGPMRTKLEDLIRSEKLQDKVELCGAVSPAALRDFTCKAFAGFTLFSARGLHHQHSLANRFFDYVHAGIPQIAINHTEYRNFNEEYDIALLIDGARVSNIQQALLKLQTNATLYSRLKDNCSRAAKENNWQNESKTLIQLYQSI
ncbi:MAG: glycosyltransferase [Cryomorphaceae bacterium]